MEDEEEDFALSPPKESESGPDAIMSLFSSYYDIAEEPAEKEESNEPSSSHIDSVNFDVNGYVKEVLSKSSMENLVSIDVKMVQEIKAIDSDLQMLVYENYAKFISATDTIKRMKMNVEAMDGDMASVLQKMNSISNISKTLDSRLDASRSKVDKLVRVQRLLERLQFLSVLPESLAKMIHNEDYKDAVQLYKKTISTLKNHSDILSFKNIQERTESMMMDLRHRVMDFLDDRSLDVTKLTHYVAILRLMDAPRDKVTVKFLDAYRSRCAAVNRELSEYVRTHASPLRVDVLKLHQSMVVGLIESTKGLQELFSGADYVKQSYESFKALIQMMEEVSGEYSVSMVRALETFLLSYDKNLEDALSDARGDVTDEILDSPKPRNPFEEEEEETHNPFAASEELVREERCRDAQLRSQAMEEERLQWLTLARHAILDWHYLDVALRECVPVLFGNEGTALSAQGLSVDEVVGMAEETTKRCSVSRSFTDAMLTVLERHRSHTLDLYVSRFVSDFETVVSKVTLLCRIRSSAQSASGDTTIRSVIAKNALECWKLLESASLSLFTSFGDACASTKVVVDVVTAASQVTSATSDASGVVFQFLDAVINRMERLNKLCKNTKNLSTLVDVFTEGEGGSESEFAPALTRGASWTDAMTRGLLSAVLFKLVGSLLVRNICSLLQEQELDGAFNTDVELQSLGVRKMADLSYRCLLSFIDTHVSALAMSFSSALIEGVESVGSSDRRSSVSAGVVSSCLALDQLVVGCCVILSESPTPLRGFTIERDVHKRGLGKKTVKRSGVPGLQLDIDRLFATKVEVFESDHIGLSLDAILKVAGKAMLKASLEVVREVTLGPEAHFQLQVDLLFAKQIVSILSSPENFNETDNLGEQALSAVDARCLDAEGALEGVSLLKTVTDGLAAISNQPTLLQR